MIYKTDYHIHTTFSDGKSSPEEYLAPALSAGIKELGFSEHLALFKDKQDWCMNPENAVNYVEHIETLKRNSKSIIIRKGLEVDYFPGKEREIEAFLSELDLDYRMGSVHYLGEISVDNGPEYFEGKNLNSVFENYFNMVIDAVSSGLFDIIAHCDLVRIYGYKPEFDPEHLYYRLARKMKEYDVAYEINTNGRNRPLGDFYPDRRFLHIFREEGVPVCVNSDAHMPSRVGQYFDEAYELLREAGYSEMAVFENRKRKMVKLNL